MKKLNSVVKRAEAERAAEHYLLVNQKCVITRRMIKTRFNDVDFFAADVVGKMKDGTTIYVQVTAGQADAVLKRKKKLEAIPWNTYEVVLMLQLVKTDDPMNTRKSVYYFKVWEYYNEHEHERTWALHPEAVKVPKEWFEAYRSPEEKLKLAEKKAAKSKEEK